MTTTLVWAGHFGAVVLAVASSALAHVGDALSVTRARDITATALEGAVLAPVTTMTLALRLAVLDNTVAMAAAVVGAHVK